MSGNSPKAGKVYLIGAGPGDPKLLTLRAVEALGASDVILYDYLVNPEVLVHAKRGAELIDVGKRGDQAGITQSEINEMLVARARAGATVARLKGGDPFLFGRGGEEAEALVEAGLEWEVVPGISAGLAVAAYAGIPITHRDYSSSVTFISGRHKNEFAFDSLRAGNDGTLVVFMCASTISKIAGSLIEEGRPASTPVAIVRWGTYQEQEIFSGTLEDLAMLSEGEIRARIQPPAIAIIGDVVSLRSKLKWFGSSSEERSLASLVDPALSLMSA